MFCSARLICRSTAIVLHFVGGKFGKNATVSVACWVHGKWSSQSTVTNTWNYLHDLAKLSIACHSRVTLFLWNCVESAYLEFGPKKSSSTQSTITRTPPKLMNQASVCRTFATCLLTFSNRTPAVSKQRQNVVGDQLTTPRITPRWRFLTFFNKQTQTWYLKLVKFANCTGPSRIP